MERLVGHSVYLIQMLLLFYFIEPHSINNYDRVDASASQDIWHENTGNLSTKTTLILPLGKTANIRILAKY